MQTPRFRFSVMPVLLALLVGVAHLLPTNVVKVAARGMGFEYLQAWRSRSNWIRAALTAALTLLSRLRHVFDVVQRHALFKPAVAAAALLLVSLIDQKALLAMPLIIGAALTEGQHAEEFLLEERDVIGRPSRENVTVLSGQNLKAGAVIGRVKLGIGRVSIPVVVGTGTGTATLVFAGPEVEVGNYVLTCTAAVAHGGVFSLTTPSGKALPPFTMTPGSGNTTAYTSRHINFSITDATDFIVGDAFTFIVSTTAPTVIGGTGTGVMTALSLGPEAKPGRYLVINRVVVANGGDFEVIAPDGASIGRFIWANAGSTAAFTSRQVNFTLSDATDYIAGNFFDIAVFNNLALGKVVAWDPLTFDGRHVAAGVLTDNIDASTADTAGVIVARHATVDGGSLIYATAISASEKASAALDLERRGIVVR
jgi:hypothetical protein